LHRAPARRSTARPIGRYLPDYVSAVDTAPTAVHPGRNSERAACTRPRPTSALADVRLVASRNPAHAGRARVRMCRRQRQDPAGIAWLRGLLRSLAGEGRTVVVASHVLTRDLSRAAGCPVIRT